MAIQPVICYRCSLCNRLYEEAPKTCVCERQVYIVGERIGPFIVIERLSDVEIKVKCLLCDCFSSMRSYNIPRQHSCGCKPRSIDILELNSEVVVYRCKKCNKTKTCRLPIVEYCCEESE